MPPILDRDAALDRVGGDSDLLAEIAQLFIDEYPGLIREIHRGIESGDAGLVERSAHSLKGAVANFAAEGARSAAFELEKIGRSKDLTNARAAYDRLVTEFNSLRPELEALLNQ